MNPSVKKAINILSYTLNVIFIVFLLIAILGDETEKPSQEDTFQSIKECILERERADIPLKVQEYERVYGITVDDMVITSKIEPYAGYLVTTWDLDEKQELTTKQWAANGYTDKYVRKQKEVYVEISNITLSKKDGSITWNNAWLSAYMSVADNK